MRRLRLLLLASAALLLALPHLGRGAPPVLLNLSGSLPVGLYLRARAQLTPGDLVAACLPAEIAAVARERGYVAAGPRCPRATAPVLKVLAATAGARVAFAGTGLLIEGRPHPGSGLHQLDHRGRPIPMTVLYPYTVGAGEVLLMAPHPRSFDGRYFGPLPEASILATYRPLWTAGE